MRNAVAIALIASLAAPFTVPVLAQEARTEIVSFMAGETGATVTGRVTGDESVNYVIRAEEGQSMEVILTPDNASTYFNVFAPGKTPGQDEAMFIGSVSGTEYSGILPADGDYVIQVFLMRNAARRNEVVNYTLDIGVD